VIIAEAFCQGLPVIASRLGAMAEIIEDGVTGLHFILGDKADLAAKVRWAADHPDDMRRMGANARRVYKQKYTPEANYRQLVAIYAQAIESGRSPE
jgi:glycosyltransferase involved in cell wall biosynthesis